MLEARRRFLLGRGDEQVSSSSDEESAHQRRLERESVGRDAPLRATSAPVGRESESPLASPPLLLARRSMEGTRRARAGGTPHDFSSFHALY